MTTARLSTRRRTALGVLSGVVVAGAVALAAPLMAQATVKKATAFSVLTAAKAALTREDSVHVKVTTASGTKDSSVVADIGKTTGTETYTSGKESFTISVTPRFAYLSGTASGLTTLMGLTTAEQKKVGTRAVAMQKGSAPYATFQKNLTSGTFANLLPSIKGTSLLAQRDKATGGYQLKWTTQATASRPKDTTLMVISSGGSTLPIREYVTSTVGKSKTIFTKWGRSFVVKIPSSTIAYAKVFPTGS